MIVQGRNTVKGHRRAPTNFVWSWLFYLPPFEFSPASDGQRGCDSMVIFGPAQHTKKVLLGICNSEINNRV